jgi:hypothetical protein
MRNIIYKPALCSILLLVQVLAAGADQAIKVGGPAGQCTYLTWTGSCYIGKNSCPYRVRLHLGPISALINPGGSWTFMNAFGGGCLTGYVGSTTANQE